MAIDALFSLPFAEQIDYFRRKLHLPSQAWDDLRTSAHDRAFVVAGAMKADLLADLHASILKHLAWDGLVLAADHPFWKQHYPPQIPPHWGCRCRVVGLERREDARALGGDPDKPLPEDWPQVDAQYKDPEQLARGWNFAPGAHTATPAGFAKTFIRVNYASKVRSGTKRDRMTSNFIRTGGLIETENLEKDARYVVLEK